ncbi:MAG: dihydroxyacetone kinase subunit DhaL [Bryobacteraceae bacterium]
MPVRAAEVAAWLRALQRVYSENRQMLTDLDAAIGDGDHGINLERGFSAVDPNAAADVAGLLQAVARTLIGKVGGASGPLYGTFFLRAAAVSAGVDELDVPAAFRAGVEGIQQRGKAAPGDKTMLDALLPAVAALEQGLGLGAAAEAAEAGARATIPMQARKGRASYLGPRSVGHQDPGAASAAMLVRAAAECWS